jgi:rhodanese-related sulfurtransferase
MIPTLVGLIALAAIVSLPLIEPWLMRRRHQRQLEESSISPEQLHLMLERRQSVLVYDLRQPLDLLANSWMIPGSERIAPKDLFAHPELIPKNENVVVYCTCPGEATSRKAVRRARDLGFPRIKFLKGGLGAWRARGYPVETYDTAFRLDTAS